MTVTLKALSALLTYPSAELQQGAADVETALSLEALLDTPTLDALRPLLRELAERDLYDLQERFVLLFDRSRSLSLNLFEHVHGESRARGQAMVDLLETSRAGGYEPVGPELPDHLPMLLEFLASRPLQEARDVLADAAHILAALRDRLDRRHSPYAAVFEALGSLAAVPAAAESLAEIAARPEDDPENLEQLDAAWAETEVTFGPDPNAGCPAGREMLARMGPLHPPAWVGSGS
jgi:nitrate reductase delta subunit